YNYQYVTKFAEAVNRGERIVPLLRRAIHALRNGRPGPTLLELHRDAMRDEVPNLDQYKPSRMMVAAPSPSDVKDAVTKLLHARRPVLWVGQGVLYAGATEELRALATDPDPGSPPCR